MTFDASRTDFKGMTKQLNINLIVGNGFDIRVLNFFGRQTTTYKDFYTYETKVVGQEPSKNIILRIMKDKKGREPYKDNWSDLESAIMDAANNESYSVEQIADDVGVLQADFATFINEIVTPRILTRVFNFSNENSLNINSFGHFSEDVVDTYKNQGKSFKFNGLTEHYDVMNWTIFNLNYTFLLDNYLSMNIDNFDPHVYKNVDRNFKYYIPQGDYEKRRGRSQTIWSDYFNIQFFHPHGHIGVPSKMLFGIDDVYQLNNQKSALTPSVQSNHQQKRLLSKTYIAQDNLRYGPYMDDGTLFIVFGSSIGETDTWWWTRMLARMTQTIYPDDLRIKNREASWDDKYKPEMIIYWYCQELTTDNVKRNVEMIENHLVEFAPDTLSNSEKENLKEQIFVVPYNDTTKLHAFSLQ